MRLITLGEFALRGPHAVVTSSLSGAARCLLARLARARRVFTRDELAAQWWPEAEPQRARASLSTALWSVRAAFKAVANDDPIVATRDTIALHESLALDLDVESFESCAARGDDAAADSWYGGPYLRGVLDDDVVAERERLAGLHESVLARLLVREPDVDRARRLIETDPYAEIGYRVLVDAALAEGTSRAARAWIRQARVAFAEIDAVPPFFADAKYRALVDVADGVRPSTNLVVESNAFYGRAREMQAIADGLLASPIVTLLGPGGSGKTRLAREFTAHASGPRAGTVWFVELAASEGQGAFESALVAALDLRDDGRPRAERIIDALVQSDGLLVADNCEHVIDEAATLLARIARAAPEVRILVTSREALRVADEVVIVIEGLPQDDAAQLFLARARAADRRLLEDDRSRRYAMRIATALDGLPLALELAAGRVRLDGLAAIAEDAVRVVGTARGPRDAGPRSSTLRASIDWSVDRLAADARSLFGRLSVFAGSFGDSDAVAIDPGAPATIDTLLDRSLLGRDLLTSRLRYLAPVRAHAARLFASDPFHDDVLGTYAAHVCARVQALLCARGDAALTAQRALDELEADIERTLDHSFASGNEKQAIDTLAAMTTHWVARGKRVTAERWLDRAQHVAIDEASIAEIAYARVRLAHDAGHEEVWLRYARVAQEAYARVGNQAGEARAWNAIGSAYERTSRHAEARAALARSLALHRAVGSDEGIATVLTNLAVSAWKEGDLASALAAWRESAPLADRFSIAQTRVRIYCNIGRVSRTLGRLEESRAALERAIEIAQAGGGVALLAFVIVTAAEIAFYAADGDAALAHARQIGMLDDAPQRYVGYALAVAACALTERGAAAFATRLASAARAIDAVDAFETEERELLARVGGSAAEAVDRDVSEARALLRML